jgi:hypothetical protein
MATTITAQLNISVRMNGASFQSTQEDITGETAQIIEKLVEAGATETITGIAFPTGKMKLLYLLSDTVDCTVTLLGTNGNTAINVSAGVPHLWYTGAGADPLSNYPIVGMTVRNLNTAGGLNTAVNTDFHGRIVLDE